MSFILLLGWITLAYISYNIFRKLYDIFHTFVGAEQLDLKKLAGANWAVVTGSTDGIGKEYAIQLAQKGFNIVLISRTQSKLDDVRQEILKKTPNVEVKIIAFDFTNANLEDYEKVIVKGLDGLDVGLLVNDVGMFYDYPDRFDKTPGGVKHLRDLVVVNTLPVTILTAEILKQMVPRNKGVVINISSTASCFTFKQIAAYSASKVFTTHLTKILIKEFSNTGIVFQAVNTGMVATKMSKGVESFFCPSPQTYVRQALKSVGHLSVTHGSLAHEIESLGLIVPDFIKDFGVERFNNDMRAKALGKKEH